MDTVIAGNTHKIAPKTLARTAGLLYLLVGAAAFNEGYVLPHIVKAGDAAATAANIRASATLFRLGFVADLVAATCWLLLAMALYLLLRHVHRLAAAAMVTFAAVGAGIQYLNQLNQYTALTVATSRHYTHGPGRAGADALALLFANMQHDGYLIAGMFFGLWLLPLSYLVIRSGYFPRVLGVLLLIGGFAYIANLFTQVLAPRLGSRIAPVFIVPAGIAELSFLVWLLVKTVKVPGPRERSPVPVMPRNG
jgi:Domain of unknown function (DUF4386)